MSQHLAVSIPLATAPIRIAGLVQGDVIAEDALVWIEAGARVEGEVRAASLFLAGELAGNCRAQSVWLQASASMTGLLECLWLAMDEGARFVGQTVMPASPPVDQVPVWPLMESASGPSAPTVPASVGTPPAAIDWSRVSKPGVIGLGVVCALMGGLSLLRPGAMPAIRPNAPASTSDVVAAAMVHMAASSPEKSIRTASAPDSIRVAATPAKPARPVPLHASDKLPVTVPAPVPASAAQKGKTPPHTPVGAIPAPKEALRAPQAVTPLPVNTPVAPTRSVASAPQMATPLAAAKSLPGVVLPPKANEALPGDVGEGELLQQLAALQGSMLNALVLESAGVKGEDRLPVVERIRSVTATLQLTRNLMRKYAHGDGGRAAYRGLQGSQVGQWEQYRHQLSRLISTVDPATLHADSRQLMASLAHLPA
ncbi:hypothetical protein THUN1379_30880 [Paludibacterium sp. THUN1379]|uniref:polymer-forming cytoskeletal protein n=1 Tax=Paludibacterium sp. THUN1379 TaxID=3112107 RepID=UPI00309001B3|nr:hypothetical protein THUN1379_30880 [Paludibacterium sp. THUN1379]